MADTADSAPHEEEQVRTGADRLLDLVKKSREIALAAAAQELGVPIVTVEAWANFLEEDGLVTVKYKFTTPYIAIPEVQAERKKKEEKLVSLAENADFSDVKAEIENVPVILSKASDERTSGEFGLLKQTYSTLAAKLSAIHEQLAAEAEITPQKKAMLNDSLRALEEGMQEAASDAESGRFDEASAAYSRLYAQATTLSKELKRLYDQVATLHAIQSTKDYKDLLGEAYKLMSEGRVEEAAELYDKLKFAHENLAKEFIEKKAQMEDDLVKFNKDLSKNVDELNMQKLKAVMRRINVLLSAGRQFLKKGEFDTAESYYLAIRHEYGTLPPGFLEEKKEMQQRVLGFYGALAMQREKAIKKKFDSLIRQIGLMTKQTQESLKELNVEQAVRMYRQIKQLYNTLPTGFLKEKSELQQSIVSLYSTINSMYTQKSLSKLKAMSAEILTLIGIMSRHTEKGELREAEEAYERIRHLYREMPKGFLHEETTLQNQIVNTYEGYLKKTKEMESGRFTVAIASITKLLDEAEQQMKKKDYRSANENYTKLMSVYNTLPAGFIAQKANVRDRVLHLYKAVLAAANLEEQLASSGGGGSAQKARGSPASVIDRITELVVEARQVISAGNFSALSGIWSSVEALAKGMPNLAKTNKMLALKISDVKEETGLYRNALSLQTFFESGNVGKLKESLDCIRRSAGALKERCPEDKALFDYVTSQYDSYLPKLMASKGMHGKEPIKSKSDTAIEEKPVEDVSEEAEMPVLPPLPSLPELDLGPSGAAEERVGESSIAQALEAPPEIAEGKADYSSQAYAADEGDIKKIDSEIDDIERKIEELKGLSRATVKPIRQ
ncbi:hypothetical protein HYY73_04780 [Candidatus Woesearchaeota archaeon]|nr:hypothetical protein [Candidatus Woesearchaeota archaeon]